jgi:hypothetical protein
MLSIFFVAASSALNKKGKKLKENFWRNVLSKAFHQSRFKVCSIEMRQVGDV